MRRVWLILSILWLTAAVSAQVANLTVKVQWSPNPALRSRALSGQSSSRARWR